MFWILNQRISDNCNYASIVDVLDHLPSNERSHTQSSLFSLEISADEAKRQSNDIKSSARRTRPPLAAGRLRVEQIVTPIPTYRPFQIDSESKSTEQARRDNKCNQVTQRTVLWKHSDRPGSDHSLQFVMLFTPHDSEIIVVHC